MSASTSGSSSRRILFLEPVGGIAGDMFLACALDLGVSQLQLEQALAGLKLPGWRFAVTRAERHAIAGTHLDVEVDPSVAQSHHRPLSEIEAMIQAAESMPPRARERALAVFRVIGEAESKIHGVPLEQIHFHEVGAIDSIIDICGAAVVLELLGDPEVIATAPPLGSGFVRSAHGNIPVPAPATLEILKEVPVRFEGVGELTTPTGAALLKTLARIGVPPAMVVERTGYGVGTKQMADRPNVLRGSIGRAVAQTVPADSTWVLEANLDDCSPQLLGALLETMLELGAHDAYVVPATMKKSRPGHLFGVVAPGEIRDALVDRLLSESTTLGVRFYPVERTMLDRRFEEVETPFGKVRIKLGERGGVLVNAHPEFDDCRKAAQAAGVPIKQVMAAALVAFHCR